MKPIACLVHESIKIVIVTLELRCFSCGHTGPSALVPAVPFIIAGPFPDCDAFNRRHVSAMAVSVRYGTDETGQRLLYGLGHRDRGGRKPSLLFAQKASYGHFLTLFTKSHYAKLSQSLKCLDVLWILSFIATCNASCANASKQAPTIGLPTQVVDLGPMLEPLVQIASKVNAIKSDTSNLIHRFNLKRGYCD